MATYWAWKKKYTDPQDLADALGDDDVNFVRRTYIKPYANTEMEKEITDETIKNLANYFIILSNLNQAIELVKNIKPTEKQK